jgi:hypothetical protein
MKSGWKKYLLYIGFAIIAGLVIYVLAETVKANNTGFETKTLWDWMDLFIIPLFLAGGVFYLNRSERENDRQRAEEHAKLEREIATDRQREAALQSYLDRMAELLLKEKLRTTKNKEVRNVAKIRTLTVLRGLDGKRKRMVLFFIREAGLIHKEKPIIDLVGADFSGADLSNFGLEGVNLNGVNLSSANLNHAYLGGASLHYADLSGADLGNAKITNEQLETVKSLNGAIMPDGSKHD